MLSDGQWVQEGVHQYRGICSSLDAHFDLTYRVTGVVVDETSICETTSGTIRIEPKFSGLPTYSMSKSPGDIYWTVSRLDSEDQLLEKYLVPVDSSFYCDFSDL